MTLEEYIISLNISTLKEYSIKLIEWVESTIPQEERGLTLIKPTIMINKQIKDNYNIYLKIYTISKTKRLNKKERY